MAGSGTSRMLSPPDGSLVPASSENLWMFGAIGSPVQGASTRSTARSETNADATSPSFVSVIFTSTCLSVTSYLQYGEPPNSFVGSSAIVPSYGIYSPSWDPSPFRYFAAQVDGQAGWRMAKLPSSHDIMVDLPNELARELMTLA